MKTVSISGSARQNVGKKDARDLRLQGRIPCVVYGGEEQIMFTAAEKDLIQLFNKPEVCFVDLDIDGKKIKAVPQDSQFHKVTDALLHVDFLELRDDRPIRMAVPLLTTGNAAGVLLPANMPENITVDVTNLDIAQEVKVKDLCSDKYQIMEDMTAAVVLVKSTRNAQAAAAAAPAE